MPRKKAAPETEDEKKFSIEENVLLDAQRVYHHVVAAMKLNKVEAAEGGCVLILISAVNL